MNDARSARAALIAGVLRGSELLARIRAVPARERDEWVDTLLGLREAPEDEALPRGAVPYLPAGVDEILAVLGDVDITPSDVFVDIGSGLGRVVLLVHLLTGAPALGIEIQDALVQAARRTARELGLASVSFRRADASDIALVGTVFFLYSPLTGEALRRVLIALRTLAEQQPIVVCAVGLVLDQERWLEPRPRLHASVSCYDAGVPKATSSD